MPKKKPSDRIESLKLFISSQENRLANLKAVQAIKAKTEAAKKEIEILETAEAKRKKEEEIEAIKVALNEKRIEDQHAKILWGAGLQLLAPTEAAHTRAKILAVLGDRDREWMARYTTEHKIALSVPEPVELVQGTKNVPLLVSESIDPAAAVLMRVLKQFDPMTLSHIEGEFLSCSDGADRGILEVLFATLGGRK